MSITTFPPDRKLTAPRVVALVGAILAALSFDPLAAQHGSSSTEAALPAAPSALHADSSAQKTKSAERLREGTRLVDCSGTFSALGADRISFSPDGGKESYRLLQNLALERISRMLEEQRGTKLWTVSGMLTEYKGANYLLVTKWQSIDNGAAAGQ